MVRNLMLIFIAVVFTITFLGVPNRAQAQARCANRYGGNTNYGYGSGGYYR